MKLKIIASLAFFSLIFIAEAQKKNNKPNEKSTNPLTIAEQIGSSFNFRLIGPALTSGRIADIAVDPQNPDKWFLAAASGGVWLTENHGTSFTPIFDNYGSYSIACVRIATSNNNIIWVGTGENNNQRSVSYGDGVYKSVDGGKSFKNMGLKNSEHIGSIVIHPENENIVWVAAYGPLWSKGGERGIYKTIDGGETWKLQLKISENTGISEIIVDPENPNVLYAAAHQRRRHEWTYIGGGPESGIYKTIDGGENWQASNNGLPEGQMGRIGLAVSPAASNVVYAIVEGKYDKGGFFRSTNYGASWEKMSNTSTSGNYYQELVCDPLNVDRVFVMDTYLQHTENGGKTFQYTGEKQKHVDNHAMWVDPLNTNHWLVGCDGGIYETFNSAKEWKFYSNLPIIQFYKVATDNALPFYNIYGGTQDNNSMGGPSRTSNVGGIMNTDWYITNGGDGFESAIDTKDPNIVYAQAQYGWLVRFDKSTGEKMFIQPQPGKNEAAYRWNWDAPLLVSPHDNHTLYFAANKVFKSMNRGDDWQVVSPDLSSQIDRNNLKVMDQVWSIDAVMKNASTTIYGNIIALDESPIKKGLLYAGTDDGLIHCSENDGQNWRKCLWPLPTVQNVRVNMLTTSQHDENVVFVALNNQRSGDFKPYLFRSGNKGLSWENIGSNLPERGTVYCIKQDHLDPNLLFVGTEFGAYFSNDGGKKWYKLGGLPTIAVYDLDIQQRENDLVAATFGRGFYVLDNYSGLRELKNIDSQSAVHLFQIKDALQFIPSDPLGLEGTGFQGANLWSTPNPEVAAHFKLYLKDEYQSLQKIREEKEKQFEKDKKDVSYPTFEDLLNEQLEDKHQLIWIISNEFGDEVKRLISIPQKGMNKMEWNLRSASVHPIQMNTDITKKSGFLVPPGVYNLQVFMLYNGELKVLTQKQKFNVKQINNQSYLSSDAKQTDAFRIDLNEINRKILGSVKELEYLNEKITILQKTVQSYPNIDLNLNKELYNLKVLNKELQISMFGDQLKASKEFETLPGLKDRIETLQFMQYETTSGVNGAQYKMLQNIKDDYANYLLSWDRLQLKLDGIESKLNKLQLPYIRD